MPTSDFTPTLPNIGALIRARTRDANGKEWGTFNSVTRPDDQEAQQVIEEAVGETALVTGANIPDAPGDPTAPGYDRDSLRKAARRIVALRAAALVELTAFPEQVARGVSPYPQLQDSFEKGLENLSRAIEAARGGDEPPGSDGAGSMDALGSFPVDTGGMITWDTRF